MVSEDENGRGAKLIKEKFGQGSCESNGKKLAGAVVPAAYSKKMRKGIGVEDATITPIETPTGTISTMLTTGTDWDPKHGDPNYSPRLPADLPDALTIDYYFPATGCGHTLYSVQNFVGDAFRGATWVSLHNGGGVGWGEVMNGGFGMLIDGSAESEQKLTSMLHWDVNNGIARRSWARNKEAQFAIRRAMEVEPRLRVTLAQNADPDLIRRALS